MLTKIASNPNSLPAHIVNIDALTASITAHELKEGPVKIGE